MKKKYLVTTICFLLANVLLVSRGSAEKAPALSTYYIGRWSGTTSQGLPIRLIIENVNGRAVVTKLGYKIELEGIAWGWSKTIDRLKPQTIRARIISFEFSYKGKFDLNVVEITGHFVSASLLKGTLRETSIYPVDIVTAVGEVTYTATKE